MQSLIQYKRIVIAFDRFFLMVLLEKPITVVLLTCMGVRAWGYPSYFFVVRIGKAFLALRKVAPIFTSADVDVTFLIS